VCVCMCEQPDAKILEIFVNTGTICAPNFDLNVISCTKTPGD